MWPEPDEPESPRAALAHEDHFRAHRPDSVSGLLVRFAVLALVVRGVGIIGSFLLFAPALGPVHLLADELIGIEDPKPMYVIDVAIFGASLILAAVLAIAGRTGARRVAALTHWFAQATRVCSFVYIAPALVVALLLITSPEVFGIIYGVLVIVAVGANLWLVALAGTIAELTRWATNRGTARARHRLMRCRPGGM